MGYELAPHNKGIDEFHFGAFSYPILIEACGAYFTCIQEGAHWEFVPGLDERMPKGDTYPRLLSNDGFPVKSHEAKVMARCARNYAAIKKSQMREDFIQKLEDFADWAEKSGGFTVW